MVAMDLYEKYDLPRLGFLAGLGSVFNPWGFGRMRLPREAKVRRNMAAEIDRDFREAIALVTGRPVAAPRS